MYKLFIGTIGTEFMPGVWESVLEAAAIVGANKTAEAIITPIDNCCIEPFYGLAMMRNWAIICGLELHASHIMLMDTDILLEDKYILEKLLSSYPVVVPTYNQYKIAKEGLFWRFQDPPIPKNEEEWETIHWSVFSCILFNTEIWQKGSGLDIRLFHDHMAIAEDQYYCDYLRLLGFPIWRNNRADVTPLAPPTPLWEKNRGKIIQKLNDHHVELKYERPFAREMKD